MSETDDRLTKAEYARRLARVGRLISQELEILAYGMWNPLFCEDEADIGLLDLIMPDLREIRQRSKPTPPTKGTTP